tara:strand:+ start:1056 stop:1235 length:180 start_codon:yes stop_codon:yes gene_type:complete
MKYVLSITVLFFFTACSSDINRHKTLNIDIYQHNMSFEKFKQYVMEYAEKSTYPSLSDE